MVENPDRLRTHAIDILVRNSVLNGSSEIKGLSRYIIKSAALEMGIISSSIQGLWEQRSSRGGITLSGV